MILGLVNLALWGSCLGGVVMSAGQAETVVMRPTEEIFTLLQQDDFDGVRARLGAPGSNVTDAELIAFREAYRSTLGDFVARPDTLVEYVNSMMRMGPWQPVLSNPGQQQIPLLATFEHGEARLGRGISVRMDQRVVARGRHIDRRQLLEGRAGGGDASAPG